MHRKMDRYTGHNESSHASMNAGDDDDDDVVDGKHPFGRAVGPWGTRGSSQPHCARKHTHTHTFLPIHAKKDIIVFHL